MFEIDGQVLKSDGKPFPRVFPVIVLRGATSSFLARTQAGPGGKFRLKNIPVGIYTIVAHIPRVGDIDKTVEISPSLADSQKRIRIELTHSPDTSIKAYSVSTQELSVSRKAWEEYESAQQSLIRGDVSNAIERLKRAVEISPQFTEAWNNLGTIAYHARRYAEAEQYFRAALEHESDAYSPLVNLGGALLSQGKSVESLDINVRAVRARPDDALGRAQLGLSYYYLGRFDEAVEQLKEAKVLDPSHFSFPQLVLADIYQRQQNYPAAVSELEEFLKLHPDSKEAPEVRKSLEKVRAQLPAP